MPLAAVARLAPRRRFTAEYVWYVLDPADPGRPRPRLPAGIELRRAGPAELELFPHLPHHPAVTTLTVAEAAERVDRGAELWLAMSDGLIAFACWTFRGWGPVHGAREGEMPLPDGIVYVEDSVTSPAFRGRGVGPATWSAIADGVRPGERLTTKVDVTNAASRRAVGKAGFREVARMEIVWRDWRTRIRVAPGAPGHDWLARVERG